MHNYLFKRYQLRGSINSSFVLLYEGLEDHFLLENAIPYANYEFEIFAYTYEEGIFLANSKAISLLTPSESINNLIEITKINKAGKNYYCKRNHSKHFTIFDIQMYFGHILVANDWRWVIEP